MSEFLNKRVKVWGTLKNGITSTFSGNLDNIIEEGDKIFLAVVDRTPIYKVTKIELNPSQFERNWDKNKQL